MTAPRPLRLPVQRMLSALIGRVPIPDPRPNEGPSTLDRWTVDLADCKVHESRFDDHAQGFPRVDERRVGKRQRYRYAPTILDGVDGGDALLKHDFIRGSTESRSLARKTRWASSCSIPHQPMRPRITVC